MALAMIAYVNYIHSVSLQVNESLNGLRSAYAQPIDWANQHLGGFDKL